MTILRLISLALLLKIAAGCGNSDPLADQPRVSTPSGRPAASTAAEGIPAPKLVTPPSDLPPDQTHPGPLPQELGAMIRAAADHFAKDERRKAFELLVDPARTGGLTVDAIAEQTPRVQTLLLEGALRKSLETPSRLSEDGEFVLIELSDTTHLRFNRIDGQWRLSPSIRPNAETPGIGYDDAEKHAAFLLRKLAGVEPATEELWTAAERPIVAALREKGAGIASGVDIEGARNCAVVLNRAFQGNDDSFATLRSLRSLNVLAVYETKVTDAGLGTAGEFPGVVHLRVIRDGISSELLASLSRARGLRSLCSYTLTKGSVSLGPMAGLESLETCELLGLGFGLEDLAILKSLPRLRRLDVSDSPLDDAAVPVIAGFPKLESIRVPDRITADGIAALRSKVPNLFIDR